MGNELEKKKTIWLIDEAVPEGRIIILSDKEYDELFSIKTDKTPEQIKEILDNYNKKVKLKDRMYMVSTPEEEEKK